MYINVLRFFGDSTRRMHTNIIVMLCIFHGLVPIDDRRCFRTVIAAGRGTNTHAYTHSVAESHHVFLNLQTLKFYCLPDNYEIVGQFIKQRGIFFLGASS